MTEPQVPVALEIRRGNPTAEEIAAVVAVVTDAYAQEIASLRADDAAPASVWMQSRRNLRAPLNRTLGWGRFRG